jgi:glycosyltransferase involved in cell wall biosynthesis
MPLMPTVSVIVPNYNHARYLRKRVDSILAQTYQDFELILLDDCSTDESREILALYANSPRVRTEFNTRNSGSTFKQWNKGVRAAHGKYVWIAESDDYADERLLENLVTRLEGEPSVVLCYCRSWQVSADDQVIGYQYSTDDADPARWARDFIADGREECRTSFSRSNSIPNASSVLFRRETYEQVGGADERLRLCGDWKLWSAMALRGNIAYVKEPLNYFRFHESSMRVQGERMGIEAAESLEVIRSIVRGMTRDSEVGKRTAVEFPRALLDGYRRGMEVLEQTDPDAALGAIDEFLRLAGVNSVSRWERADAWLRASRIQYRLGRPGKALVAAGRAFLARPTVAGRPAKRLLRRARGIPQKEGEAREL